MCRLPSTSALRTRLHELRRRVRGRVNDLVSRIVLTLTGGTGV